MRSFSLPAHIFSSGGGTGEETAYLAVQFQVHHLAPRLPLCQELHHLRALKAWNGDTAMVLAQPLGCTALPVQHTSIFRGRHDAAVKKLTQL